VDRVSAALSAAAVCWLLLNPNGLIGEPAARKRVHVLEAEEIDAGKRLP
jgi:hypothetical protein